MVNPLKFYIFKSWTSPKFKRLASRISVAQAKVRRARDGIINYGLRIKNCKEELALFEYDPEGYARKRYGNHGVDSYPVTTRIANKQAELESLQENLPRKHIELEQAERSLAQIETEVAQEMSTIRNSSRGRVEWPSPLPSFEQHEAAHAKDRNAHDEAFCAQRSLQEREQKAMEVAENLRLQNEADQEWKAWWNTLTEAERTEHREWIHDFKSKLDAGLFTFEDFLEHLRSRRNDW